MAEEGRSVRMVERVGNPEEMAGLPCRCCKKMVKEGEYPIYVYVHGVDGSQRFKYAVCSFECSVSARKGLGE
jgi:hypothetical protein